MTGLESIKNGESDIEFSFIDDIEIKQQPLPRPGTLSELDRMVSEFEKEFVEKNALPIETLNAQAKDYYAKGNHKAAAEIYQQILTTFHYDQEILFETYKNLGNISMTTGDYDGAEENFNR